jgi:hypothetical protein
VADDHAIQSFQRVGDEVTSMRRFFTLLGTAVLLVAGGCGLTSYEARMDKTLENMKYKAKLDKYLAPPMTKGKWEELLIYLRPPKGYAAAKEFFMSAPEPGKFDLEVSFLENQKPTMHVLARRKIPKGAAKKKGAPTAADTADRTDFNRDLTSLLTSSFSPQTEVSVAKFKATSEKNNEYKYGVFNVEDKDVQVYVYKRDPYEIALIFEVPKAERTSMGVKNRLCLEAFAVGDRAKRAFEGLGADDDSGGAGGAPTTPTGVVF